MNKKGFTLIELMIVVAIIAILAMIAIPMYQRYIERSRNSATQNLLHQLSTAMTAYNVDTSIYVTDTGGPATDELKVDALLPYGFRVDPNVAFQLYTTTPIGGVTHPGFIACAAHRARGSRLYAYDNIAGSGVMAMQSSTNTLATPTVPTIAINTACTSPLNLWVPNTTNPTGKVDPAAVTPTIAFDTATGLVQ